MVPVHEGSVDELDLRLVDDAEQGEDEGDEGRECRRDVPVCGVVHKRCRGAVKRRHFLDTS